MKNISKHVSVALLSALALVGVAALILGQKVKAAGEGKITGSVKLSGTAPHMKGIDMSKDPYCVKANATPAHLETVVAGASGGLENVVLYISAGLPAGAEAEVPTTVPVFDQKNCMYTPHVLALDVNQKFKVTTSDQTTHNIHPWMHGWYVVVKGPYGTTDANGSYTINNVPPGSYTVTAWQEDLGTQTAKVTVAGGAAATADFTFKAK